MGIAAYKYEADNGLTYQVVLPDDLAVQLGYAAAAGTEVYVPAYIAPRYATYIAPSNGLDLSAIITKHSVFALPPQTVTLSGITFQLVNLVGEKRVSAPLGSVITVAGPQGAKGEKGDNAVFSSYYAECASDVAMTSINTSYDACGIAGVAAGTYLGIGTIQFQTGASACKFTAFINGTGFVGRGSTTNQATANQWTSVSVAQIFTIASSTTIKLSGYSSATSATIRANTDQGTAGASRLCLLKI